MLRITLLWIAAACVQDPTIAPEQASEHVGKEVTVKFTVESARWLKDRDLCFLNSKADHRDDQNFTVVLRRAALAGVAEKNIDDPAAYFRGKKILARGKIESYRGRPQIAVEQLSHVKIVVQKTVAAEAPSEDAGQDVGADRSPPAAAPDPPAPKDGGGRLFSSPDAVLGA